MATMTNPADDVWCPHPGCVLDLGHPGDHERPMRRAAQEIVASLKPIAYDGEMRPISTSHASVDNDGNVTFHPTGEAMKSTRRGFFATLAALPAAVMGRLAIAAPTMVATQGTFTLNVPLLADAGAVAASVDRAIAEYERVSGRPIRNHRGPR